MTSIKATIESVDNHARTMVVEYRCGELSHRLNIPVGSLTPEDAVKKSLPRTWFAQHVGINDKFLDDAVGKVFQFVLMDESVDVGSLNTTNDKVDFLATGPVVY